MMMIRIVMIDMPSSFLVQGAGGCPLTLGDQQPILKAVACGTRATACRSRGTPNLW